jgi:MoaA/NifB/PqqE/SkfB family radical SAM enzyme
MNPLLDMNERKIISIAPSFNCKLKCEGCYLTSDVTKEMRDALRKCVTLLSQRVTGWP